ncbi:hypothetical protein BDB00DRAFT_874760 [Zychaea mexicana]|uniref:uncharacterized protein n=1 Tax=Zychaea mexicana TaxID=64656 RepID=UPI0022FED952|nr:uncharacterized protein BDB00DRAFT_874760 [Zychaea mexicana]KAI9491075.1 hypothetical protein BDB00DRAFT_874760 [Zychaea mexicana]
MEDKVYQESNSALDTLSSVWEATLDLLRVITEASSNSMRSEPNLMQLQKHRKSLDALLDQLKTQSTWLQENKDKANRTEAVESNPGLDQALQEQRELRQESIQLSDQLKQLLSQSYALQFQMDMLLASCHDHPLVNNH